MENKRTLETHVEEAAMHAGGLLRSRYGLWTVAGISFVESALLIPIITDPFLVAYILANKTSAYRAIAITTCASLLGGLFAYAIAFLFYEFIVAQYVTGSAGQQFFEIVSSFQEGVFLVTLTGAVTPIPYTLVAFGAGFVKASVLVFLAASFIGRGGRYLIVGILTKKFGEQALDIIRRNMIIVTGLCIVAALIYIVVLQ